MAALAAPLVGSLVSGLAGLFGGGPQQKIKTEGTISNQQSGSFNQSGSSSPNLTPLQEALIRQFTGGASDLFSQSQNLDPYAASGLKQINSGSDIIKNILQGNLANRGLSFSPAAGTAETQNELNRVNQGSQFLQSLPLLQRQLQQGSLDQLMKAFAIIPTGTTTTGSGTTDQSSIQHQSGTNLVSGNPTAGLFSGLGAGLLGPNPQGTGNNLSSIIGGLGKLFGSNGVNPSATPGTTGNYSW